MRDNQWLSDVCLKPALLSMTFTRVRKRRRCIFTDALENPVQECPSAAEVPPHATVKATFPSGTSNHGYSKYFECDSGYEWLSGLPGRSCDCIEDQWTPITDVCDEGESLHLCLTGFPQRFDSLFLPFIIFGAC